MTAAEPPEMVVATHQTQVLHALPPVICKTLPVLSDALGLTRRQASRAARLLIRKGLVERVEVGCFRLTPDGERAVTDGIEITAGPNAPLETVRRPMVDTLRQRAWTAMRIKRAFTIADLLVAGTQGSERNAAHNLQIYLRNLARAGVVRRMKRRVAGTRPTSNGFLK